MLRFFEENSISLQLSELIKKEQITSGKNKIELLQHKLLGKILVINNEIQHIEVWQSLYHENVIHIPSSFIPVIRRALILGGGSFFAAKEILKYNSIEEVIMVDYDEEIIRVVRQNYDHVESIISNKKFKLISTDLFEFLKNNTIKFDLIVNDAVDLLDYGTEMYDVLASHLTQDGLCSGVVYRHIFESERCRRTIFQLRVRYNAVFSLITIPEYPGILHLLSMWSHSSTVLQDARTITNDGQNVWLRNNVCPCEVYHPSFINYYLYLPPYLKKWINNI